MIRDKFLKIFFVIIKRYQETNFLLNCVICFLTFVLNSCNYYLPVKSSQLGYQDKDNYVVNGVKLEKFNPKKLEEIILRERKKYIFIVYLKDNSCAFVARQNKELLNKYCLNERVFLIPVVHDYFMNFKNLCKIDTSKLDRIYYTDKKYFGKTMNSIKDFNLRVIGYFYKNNKSYSTNYIFDYKLPSDSLKKVIFFSSGNTDLDSLIMNSTKFNFTFER